MPAPDRRQPRTDARPQKRFFAQLRSAGSGQIEMRRSPLASGGAAAVGPQSTGVCRLRGEPRQCGVRAHRLIPPSLAPTGERRPSMACLRPIPALPRLSPSGCPWLRRYWLRHAESNVPPKRGVPNREGRRCKGISSERYMDVPRPRVGAGRATTRRTKSPCSGGPRPKRSFCPCSSGPRLESTRLVLLLLERGAYPDRDRAWRTGAKLRRCWGQGPCRDSAARCAGVG